MKVEMESAPSNKGDNPSKPKPTSQPQAPSAPTPPSNRIVINNDQNSPKPRF